MSVPHPGQRLLHFDMLQTVGPALAPERGWSERSDMWYKPHSILTGLGYTCSQRLLLCYSILF